MAKLRVALVHDLIGAVGGSEQVLMELHRMFPEAPIYMALYKPSRNIGDFAHVDIRTSFLQCLTSLGPNYEAVVPLMLMAFVRFDLRGYVLFVRLYYSFY